MLRAFLVPVRPRWYEFLVVLIFACIFVHKHSRTTNFHGDESHWIHSSTAFEKLITLDFSSQTWDTQYWTLTQPPMIRYLIGLGRRAGGFGPEEVNLPYNFDKDYAQNREEGRKPADRLLFYSRQPMVLVAGLSFALIYLELSGAFSRLAGLLALILLGQNALIMNCLPRAMSEGPQLLCSIAAWMVARTTLQVSTRSQAVVRNSIMAGLICGLTALVKLTGFAYCGIFVSAFFVRLHQFRKTAAQKLSAMLGYTIVLLAIMWFVFVIFNPFLYTSPLKKLEAMYRHRLQEMNIQTEGYTRWVYKSRIDGVRRISSNAFSRFATINRAEVSIPLGLIGLITLLGNACWRRGRSARSAQAFLLTSLFATGPWLLSPIDWSRYQFIPVAFAAIIIAIGFARATELLAARTFR